MKEKQVHFHLVVNIAFCCFLSVQFIKLSSIGFVTPATYYKETFCDVFRLAIFNYLDAWPPIPNYSLSSHFTSKRNTVLRLLCVITYSDMIVTCT